MFANRNIRLILGVFVLLVAVGVIAAAQALPQAAPPAVITTLNCIGGSEKQPLLQDQQIVTLLHDRYNLQVNFSSRGSLALVQLATDDLKQQKVDCLWPSNASAQLVFEQQHKLADFAGYKAENVLNSPLVIYSWAEPTAALQAKGIVEQHDGQYFIIKMQDLVNLIGQNTTWESISAPNLRGPIRLKSTNPTASNSGNILYLLLLNIIATGNDATVATLDTALPVLPQLRKIYLAQGLQPTSSGFGFEQYLTQGVGAFPLYAGYESQILEASVQTPDSIKGAMQQLRILYPQPTAWSSHPILALDAAGQQLITAMKDPEIQQLAWSKHGFRSTVVGIANKTTDFPLITVPETIIRVVDLPGPDVILKMNDCLMSGNCS